MTSKRVILMRGVSGSGKSTYIKRHLSSEAYICSADHFFVQKDGSYKFNPKLLALAHDACKKKFKKALHSGDKALVVVDNTNTRLREYKEYMKVAKAAGYEVEFVRMDVSVEVAAARNAHGVPLEAVARMASRMDEVPKGYRETVVSGMVE